MSRPIHAIRNLGTSSVAGFAKAGITTAEQIEEMGDKLDDEDRAGLTEAIEAAKKAVESGQIEELEAAKKTLEERAHKLAEKAYAQATTDDDSAPGDGANASDEGGDDDDVIDAEFDSQ